MNCEEKEKFYAQKYRNNLGKAVNYWDWVAQTYGKEGEGLKAVGFLGAPTPINQYQDSLQKELIIPLLKKTRGSILEVGCGIGRWIRRINQCGASILGCDVSRTMIRIAKERFENVPFVVCSLSDLPFRDELFDGVLSVTVLQHITDSQIFKAAIKEIVRVTKGSGALILLEQIGEGRGLIVEPRPLESYARNFERYDYEIAWWRGVSVMPYDRVLGIILRKFRFMVKPISWLFSTIDLIITQTRYFSSRSPWKLLLVKKKHRLRSKAENTSFS